MLKRFRHDMLQTSNGCGWATTAIPHEEDKLVMDAIHHIYECEKWRENTKDFNQLYFIVKNLIERVPEEEKTPLSHPQKSITR